MQRTKEIFIGNKGRDFVALATGGRGPEGWFGAEVRVSCEGWSGVFNTSFMKGELKQFADELVVLQKNLIGMAKLEPIEPQLTLSFSGDGKGHIDVRGAACSQLGSRTSLSFAFELDQTYLQGIISALVAADPD